MNVTEMAVKKRPLAGAYNPYRYIRFSLCKKLGKKRRETFAAVDGGVIYIFSDDEVFILDAAAQNNT